ncbi:hypothetical protein D3C71_1059390 [compost metagenome]
MLEQAFCANRMVSKLDTCAMRWRMVAASYTHKGVPNWSARDHSWAGEKGLDMGTPKAQRLIGLTQIGMQQPPRPGVNRLPEPCFA